MGLEGPAGKPRHIAARLQFAGLLALLASLFLLFDDVILSGGENGIADIVDGRLVLATLEHWYRVLSGEIAWNQPGYFFPYEHALGLTDTFLLNGSVHSVFRFFGLEPLSAMSASAAVFAVLGFLGFRKLLCRYGVDPWLALVFSALFLVGTPIQAAVAYSRVQLLSIWLLPWVVLLFAGGLDAFAGGHRKRATLLVALSAALFSLIAISNYYIAWFSVFVAALGFLVFFLPRLAQYRSGLRWLGERRSLWIAGTLTVVPFLALFLVIYLPPRLASGGWPFEVAQITLPPLSYIGSNNEYGVFWNELIRLPLPVADGDHPQQELTFGFPWLFLAVFLCAWLVVLWRSLRNPGGSDPGLVKLGVIILAGWMLMMRFDDFSLWRWVMAWFPGADGIRAVYRINMIYYALALVFLALAATKALPAWRVRRPVSLAVLLVGMTGLLLVENVQQPYPHRLRLSDEAQLQAMLRPPSFPVDAFWAWRSLPAGTDERRVLNQSVDTHILAIRASQLLGIPTINGYAAVTPPGWNLLGKAASGPVFTPVAGWLLSRRFEGRVAMLDIESGQWSDGPVDPMERLALELGDLTGHNVAVAPATDALFLSGWSRDPVEYRWSVAPAASVWIPNVAHSDGLALQVSGHGYVPGDHALEVEIRLGERLAAEYRLSRLSSTVDSLIPLEPSDFRPDGVLEIRFRFSEPVSPKSVGESWDPRRLGLALARLELVTPP